MATNLPSPVAERLRALAEAQEATAAVCARMGRVGAPSPNYHNGAAQAWTSAAAQLRALAAQEDAR